ncbi:carbonic anhydrase [Beutenbergia cavernae DSM 12333]|uniref:carbonic anhydrase n=1 Tax=Beutenbergia cavernae (strain ATCC BAA-8 / DSM 12333 / CCUG 43141 / JCM 11478 / NBRC 16432 / NCIMB 13614 / HKI 0122) TaxID=471853 RepID=C5C0V0_BEUC1|nr:carbonic anhydrase [Beutenbergia cavernae]ACQ79354.1 carbonic anhydrase [Beutenbergia cavernae DSM 12333]
MTTPNDSPRRPTTPAEAWEALRAGNERFVAGRPEHPSQGVELRAKLSREQHPFAVIFGCSDSRLAAEIIFDQGLGDAFVVRTAGHVVDTTVIGSIEYGVDVLHAPLVVVLGHDYCGAIQAAVDALVTGELPTGFVRAIVDRVIPSIVTPTSLAATRAEEGPDGRTVTLPPPELVLREHVTNTTRTLQAYSERLSRAIAEGRCAIVGVEYALADGRAKLVAAAGDVGAEVEPPISAS